MRYIRISVSLIRENENQVKRREKVSKLFKVDFSKYKSYDTAEGDFAGYLKLLRDNLQTSLRNDIPGFMTEQSVRKGSIRIRYKYKQHYLVTEVSAHNFLDAQTFSEDTIRLFHIRDLFTFMVAVDRNEVMDCLLKQSIDKYIVPIEETDYVISKCKDDEEISRLKKIFSFYYPNYAQSAFADAIGKMAR